MTTHEPEPPDDGERPLVGWTRPMTETAYRVAERFSVAEQNYNLACDDGHRWWSPEPASFTGAMCRASALRTRDGMPDGRSSCELPLQPLGRAV